MHSFTFMKSKRLCSFAPYIVSKKASGQLRIHQPAIHFKGIFASFLTNHASRNLPQVVSGSLKLYFDAKCSYERKKSS